MNEARHSIAAALARQVVDFAVEIADQPPADLPEALTGWTAEGAHFVLYGPRVEPARAAVARLVYVAVFPEPHPAFIPTTTVYLADSVPL